MDDSPEKENLKIKELEAEVHNLKEQLQSYIPRRRVRRVFKQLKKVLEQDIPLDDNKYLDILKKFIKEIEVNGKVEAGQDIKEAIEYVLSRYEIQEELESDLAKNAILYEDIESRVNVGRALLNKDGKVDPNIMLTKHILEPKQYKGGTKDGRTEQNN